MAKPKGYSYSRPRSLNPVSLLVWLLVAAGVYGAYKFGPVYWQRNEVDEIIAEGAHQATGIANLQVDPARHLSNQIFDALAGKLGQKGLTEEDNNLKVFFTDNYEALVADYDVVIVHPVGKPTTLHFRREAPIP